MRRLNFHDRAACLATLALVPSCAAAHTGSAAWHWWTFDPWVWLPMALVAALYLRGLVLSRMKRDPAPVAAFAAGMAVLFFALIWPLDALAEISFAAHMAQHMLLIALAAPLLVLSNLPALLLTALPRHWRKPMAVLAANMRRGFGFLLQPRTAFTLHTVIIWIWHAPLLFEAALRWRWVHVLEHFAFFGSALLFWASLARSGRRGGAGQGAAALWCLGMLMHTGLLGALITFAPRRIYAAYSGEDGLLPPLADQQLAGLLMWVPAGVCYLVAGVALGAAWLRAAEGGGS